MAFELAPERFLKSRDCRLSQFADDYSMDSAWKQAKGDVILIRVTLHHC